MDLDVGIPGFQIILRSTGNQFAFPALQVAGVNGLDFMQGGGDDLILKRLRLIDVIHQWR